MPSIYFPHILEEGIIELEGDEFHHLIHVSRYKLQDEVIINNGMGQLSKGIIKSITKRSAQIELFEIQHKIKSKPDLGVAFALLKNKNDLWLIEKLTELGIGHFYPFESRYSLRKNIDSSQDKMVKTCISAIKQCNNAFLPEIHPVQSLDVTVTQLKKDNTFLLVASEKEESKTLFDEIEIKSDRSICFFIGPEGGFHKDEFSMFQKAGLESFSLGNHILRAETAAITVASLLTHYFYKQDKGFY